MTGKQIYPWISVTAGNGYGYGFIPMMDNRYGFRYVMKVTGTSIQRYYPLMVYPLPSLIMGGSSHARDEISEADSPRNTAIDVGMSG
jgi:hypothetical protein